MIPARRVQGLWPMQPIRLTDSRGCAILHSTKFTSECIQTQLLPAQSYTRMQITHFTHVTALFNRENMFDTKSVLQLRVTAINHNSIRHQTFSISSHSHCHRDSYVHAKKETLPEHASIAQKHVNTDFFTIFFNRHVLRDMFHRHVQKHVLKTCFN